MEDKIRSCEDIVSQLQFQQDSCRPYLKLGKDSEALVKLQQTLNTLKKQNTELENEYRSSQDALEDNQMRSEMAKKFSDKWIASFCKRHKIR